MFTIQRKKNSGNRNLLAKKTWFKSWNEPMMKYIYIWIIKALDSILGYGVGGRNTKTNKHTHSRMDFENKFKENQVRKK